VDLIGTSAWYAPGAAAAYLIKSVLRDQKKVITCSVELDGEYGQKDICIGVPVVVGRRGVEQILDYKLNEEEMNLFIKSCNAVRATNNILKNLGVL